MNCRECWWTSIPDDPEVKMCNACEANKIKEIKEKKTYAPDNQCDLDIELTRATSFTSSSCNDAIHKLWGSLVTYKWGSL
jgi:hypothetical protein